MQRAIVLTHTGNSERVCVQRPVDKLELRKGGGEALKFVIAVVACTAYLPAPCRSKHFLLSNHFNRAAKQNTERETQNPRIRKVFKIFCFLCQ